MRNYCKIAACFIFVAGIMGISASTIFGYSGGPPDGRTGSPADNLQTCNDTGCHNNYESNSGSAVFSISAPGSYTSGETLNMIVSFGSSTTAKHGFELTALDANNSSVGTFSNPDANTQVSTNYIKHTSAGSSQSGNASWNVQWTAPTDGQGVVTFYAAGNEANGDFTNQGDHIYTTTEQISAAAATPTATPTPTTSECEPEAITLDTKKPNLKLSESKKITVTVRGSDDCKPEGATVKAVIKTGKDRVTINATTATTDANGQATFTITAGQKNGNSKVVFTVEDSEGGVYTAFVTVKIRKK